MSTKELQAYLHRSIRLYTTTALFGDLLLNLDALFDNPKIIENKASLLQSWKAFEAEVTWSEYFQMQAEIIVSRDIDGFLTYLSQILLRVFSEKPQAFRRFFDETGKRGDTDKKFGMRDILDYLLQYNSTIEVIMQLAQDQVDALGYKGLDTIIDELNSRLKLNFNRDTPEYKSSCELVEIRNIITHNNCCVSKIFLKRTQRTDLKVGDKFSLSFEFVSKELKKFRKFAKALDDSFISHFNLATDTKATQATQEQELPLIQSN